MIAHAMHSSVWIGSIRAQGGLNFEPALDLQWLEERFEARGLRFMAVPSALQAVPRPSSHQFGTEGTGPQAPCFSFLRPSQPESSSHVRSALGGLKMTGGCPEGVRLEFNLFPAFCILPRLPNARSTIKAPVQRGAVRRMCRTNAPWTSQTWSSGCWRSSPT